MSLDRMGYQRPMYTADSVASIDFKIMGKEAEYWMFDLDGVLAAALRYDIRQDAVENIQSALVNGLIQAACIISNAAFSFMSHRVANLANRCGLPYLSCHLPYPMKPSQLAFDTAATLIAPVGFDRSRIMIVGDQLGTDMAAGRYGCKTMLVPTLEPIPWWKRRKHGKEDQIRREMVIVFPHELRRG